MFGASSNGLGRKTAKKRKGEKGKITLTQLRDLVSYFGISFQASKTPNTVCVCDTPQGKMGRMLSGPVQTFHLWVSVPSVSFCHRTGQQSIEHIENYDSLHRACCARRIPPSMLWYASFAGYWKSLTDLNTMHLLSLQGLLTNLFSTVIVYLML